MATFTRRTRADDAFLDTMARTLKLADTLTPLGLGRNYWAAGILYVRLAKVEKRLNVLDTVYCSTGQENEKAVEECMKSAAEFVAEWWANNCANREQGMPRLYHQRDPRGCSLWIMPANADPLGYHENGVACYMGH